MERSAGDRQSGARFERAGDREAASPRAAGGGTAGSGRAAAVVDIWAFSVQPAIRAADLTGYSIEATDGSIGKVDEATEETGSSYLIVDTGPWIFGKKVMLPAGVVERVDPDSETVFVNRSKEEIKNAPEYDEERGHRDDEYRGRLGEYYSTYGAQRFHTN